MAQSLLKTGLTDFKPLDELLKQLVVEAQQQAPFTEGRQLALDKLVDEILRSRPILRPFEGYSLLAVQKEIYEQVRQQLFYELSDQLEKYNLIQTDVREWAAKLRYQAFKKILSDAQLKKLALAAQESAPNSQLRRHILGELIKAIQLSERLCRPHREKFSPSFYELLYEEAVIQTWIYIYKNIDKYDPERGDKKFMNWVNFRLDKTIIDCRRQFSHLQNKELPSLSQLEKIVQPEKSPTLSEMIRHCVEEDAENIFRQTQIKNRPDASFRTIAMARFSGKTWEEISTELGISIPTLSSFFQRCCRKFSNHFKNYVQN